MLHILNFIYYTSLAATVELILLSCYNYKNDFFYQDIIEFSYCFIYIYMVIIPFNVIMSFMIQHY